MTITATDTVTGNVLDSVSVSSFNSGKWLRWIIAGPVQFTFTKTAGPDACISGIFIDPAPPITYVQRLTDDATTQGTWKPSVYGTQGYRIEDGTGTSSSHGFEYNTSAASWSILSGGSYAWASSTTETKAPQKPSSDRIAACVYDSAVVVFNVTTDSDAHKSLSKEYNIHDNSIIYIASHHMVGHCQLEACILC